jgi:hypothetical protein
MALARALFSFGTSLLTQHSLSMTQIKFGYMFRLKFISHNQASLKKRTPHQ